MDKECVCVCVYVCIIRSATQPIKTTKSYLFQQCGYSRRIRCRVKQAGHRNTNTRCSHVFKESSASFVDIWN
jgi:hypothetical protein